MSNVNRSLSESNISEVGSDNSPVRCITRRNKRIREEDLPAEFNSFKEELRQLMTSFISTQQMQLQEIRADLKEIQQTNYNIDQSISLLMSHDEEFRKKIEMLETQAKIDRDNIVILENKIEDLQRVSRKTCVELKNVPKKSQESSEDLIKMVLCLSETINVKLESRDIKDIFRLPSRKQETNSNSPIVVELGSTILKSELLKQAKSFNIKNKIKIQAKHLGHTTKEDTPVFLAEHLTPQGARLFFLARDLVKTGKYKYCWTSYGKILVRKDDTSKVIHITNESQIHNLVQSAWLCYDYNLYINRHLRFLAILVVLSILSLIVSKLISKTGKPSHYVILLYEFKVNTTHFSPSFILSNTYIQHNTFTQQNTYIQYNLYPTSFWHHYLSDNITNILLKLHPQIILHTKYLYQTNFTDLKQLITTQLNVNYNIYKTDPLTTTLTYFLTTHNVWQNTSY